MKKFTDIYQSSILVIGALSLYSKQTTTVVKPHGI